MSLLEFAEKDGPGWTRIGELYEVTRKPRQLDLSSLDTIPFTAMEAIPDGASYAPGFVLKAPDAITSGTYYERGDLLVAKITPSFENGKQALTFDLPAPFGYATTEVIPLRPRESGQDRRLLFFYLLHPDIRHYVAERMEGTTGRQRVPESVLLDLPFPEIEPTEQSAIADALELIQRTSRAEGRCEKAAKDLKRAAVRALFTRGLRGKAPKETEIGSLPESWNVVALGSIGRVGNGSTPKKSVRAYWDGGDFPWLTSAKVYDRDIVKADQYVTPTALKECHLPIIEPGAILIAITGQGKTLGHCAVLRMRATINQHVAYVATDLERANPSFIRGYLETQYGYFRQIGAGGGSTKGALTCAFLRSLPIPLPPTMDEQHEIVAILDAIDRKIDLHKRKRAALDELFKALLHKLMTGEIRVADLDISALNRTAPVAEVAA
jgi:type I restriction enzyme S subunit